VAAERIKAPDGIGAAGVRTRFVLAAWPATRGGRRGTGDGLELIRAPAADVRRDGGILVCTARTVALAERYRAETGAVTSPANPRLLRWP
jgi:hypothetical protein